MLYILYVTNKKVPAHAGTTFRHPLLVNHKSATYEQIIKYSFLSSPNSFTLCMYAKIKLSQIASK